MDFDSLRSLGWQPYFENQISTAEHQQLTVARVAAHYGSQVLFFSVDAEFSVPTSIVEDADLEGRGGVSSIAVGDWFLLEPVDHRAVRRLERKTILYRKAAGETVKPQLIAANVDTVFIVSSCNLDFNLSRIERYLALVLDSEAVPVVVLTKSDLCEHPGELRRQAERLHPGLIVETLDAREEAQTEVLAGWCGLGQTIALLGSSGVGKSTLANALSGHHLPTSQIRAGDDKGRHTTTARSLHRLKSGGWLIDNPGMRELQLPACEQGVAELFDDVVQLSSQCKFRNCRHQGDVGCALGAAVEAGELDSRRLANFLKLQSEQSRNSASLAERREQGRKLGKMYKRIIDDKRRRREGGG